MSGNLTKQIIRDLRRSLTEPRTPAALKAYCDKLRHDIGADAFFNTGGLSFLREAHTGADFGAARGASFIRLVPEAEQIPDYELIFSDRTECFEQVEADEKGRRRGQEYKKAAANPTPTVRDIALPTDNELIAMVKAAADNKAKSHPAGTQLVILLNQFCLPSDGDHDDLVGLLRSFSGAVSGARPFFSAIWIMWQGIPHQLFPVSATDGRG